MLWWYDKRSRLLFIGVALTAMAAISAAVIPGKRPTSSTPAASTTVAPTPIPAITTQPYAMRVTFTNLLNDVAVRGGFIPTVTDINSVDGAVALLEDADGNGFDDDGIIELSRGADVVCVQLPGEADGTRVMTITDGTCRR